MKKRFLTSRWIAIQLLILALISSSNPALASTAAHYNPISLNAQEKIMISLINQDRAKYGLQPLIVDNALCSLARMKSTDMVARNKIAHNNPTYGSAKEMLKKYGVSFLSVGENIARNRTVYHSQAAFLSSSGHRRNLLSKSYTHIGVGIALDKNGFVYVTQLFVRR